MGAGAKGDGGGGQGNLDKMQLEVNSQSVGLEQCLHLHTLNGAAGSVSTDTVPPKKGQSD